MTLLQVVGTKDLTFLITLYSSKLQDFYDELATESHINDLATLGRLIGGFGALFYISFRVWKHMANNEPINVFPLLRPFFIGFCLMIFPSIIHVMNALFHPMITVTEDMVGKSQPVLYDCNRSTSWPGLPNDWFCTIIKYPVSQLLLYFGQAVAMGLSVLRLFYLILLAMLGPIAFALSIFDGFEGNLAAWIRKYVTIYMWLPVLNLLQMTINKILVGLLSGDDFGTVVIFLIISIYTYTKVPAVTSWIVEAGGGGGGFEQAGGAAAAGFVGGLATRVGPVAGVKAIGGLAAAKMSGGASMAARKK